MITSIRCRASRACFESVEERNACSPLGLKSLILLPTSINRCVVGYPGSIKSKQESLKINLPHYIRSPASPKVECWNLKIITARFYYKKKFCRQLC